MEKMTSAEWVREYGVGFSDFSGWPKETFNYSFYLEKITKAEFEERLLNSVAADEDGNYYINNKQNDDDGDSEVRRIRFK